MTHPANHQLATSVHQIPNASLSSAVPDLDVFTGGWELRRVFALWITAQPTTFNSWQEAWNAWTGASERQFGSISLTTQCPDCDGRLFTLRWGMPQPCTTCMGGAANATSDVDGALATSGVGNRRAEALNSGDSTSPR